MTRTLIRYGPGLALLAGLLGSSALLADEDRRLGESLIHEAILAPAADSASHRADFEPPAAVPERPGSARPRPDAVWVDGYWTWDARRADYLWMTGTWRVPPPGRRWVEGRWLRDGRGWLRAPGFWSDRPAELLSYVDRIPAPSAGDRPGPAPSPEAFWVPGHEAPEGEALVWKPGYWARKVPGWTWVDPRWVSTPRGSTYQEGYWDRPIAARTGLDELPSRRFAADEEREDRDELRRDGGVRLRPATLRTSVAPDRDGNTSIQQVGFHGRRFGLGYGRVGGFGLSLGFGGYGLGYRGFGLGLGSGFYGSSFSSFGVPFVGRFGLARRSFGYGFGYPWYGAGFGWGYSSPWVGSYGWSVPTGWYGVGGLGYSGYGLSYPWYGAGYGWGGSCWPYGYGYGYGGYGYGGYGYGLTILGANAPVAPRGIQPPRSQLVGEIVRPGVPRPRQAAPAPPRPGPIPGRATPRPDRFAALDPPVVERRSEPPLSPVSILTVSERGRLGQGLTISPIRSR